MSGERLFCWIVGAIGGFWSICLISNLKGGNVQDTITVLILLTVSVTLIETKVNRKESTK